MRVLVISLLRLGDFIQAVPVINGLQAKMPNAKIDVLVHPGAAQLRSCLPQVKRWWTLNRDELQLGLGQGEIPLLTSFSVLKEMLDAVNATRYDLVVNVTHTEFSGWVAGYIEARDRIGLAYSVNGQPGFHSPWFEYLNARATGPASDIFHHSDIFAEACGLESELRSWDLHVSDDAKAELAALQLPDEDLICLQTQTADPKKTWSQSSWLRLIHQLQVFHPRAHFVLLGAPFERPQLNELTAMACDQGLRVSLAVLSLPGTLALLKKSRLLVTGDTSIKHLANATSVDVLELSLGPSDFRRTGAYKNNAVIVQARVACAPCPHSAPCSQSHHACAQILEPEIVVAVAHQILLRSWSALSVLAQEFRDEVQLIRPQLTEGGFWWPMDLSEPLSRLAVQRLVERWSWKFMLNQNHKQSLPQYGSEAIRLATSVKRLCPGQSGVQLLAELEFLENRAKHQLEQATKVKGQSRPPLIPVEQGQPTSITDRRRMQIEVERQLILNQIELKLIGSIKSQLTEYS